MNTIIEEMLVNKVEERVGDGYSVRIRDVGKNNGVSRTAMEFTERGDCMGTLVYLDEIFSEEPSEADVDRIADQIAEIGCQEKPVDQAGVKKFLNWDYARSRLVVRLVNAKWNSESLKGIPHRDFLDLEVTYSLLLNDYEESGMITASVTDQMFRLWGVSEEELYMTALENMRKRLPESCRSIASVIGIEEDENEAPLYVLSNSGGAHGAAALLYSDAPRKMAERNDCDVYILPSSVHEVLLLPANNLEGRNEAEMLAMVRTINRTQVERQDWLSDNIYRYCRTSGEIAVISQAEAA